MMMRKNINMNNITNKQQTILNYLEKSYSDAKFNDDVELMIRLTRAILAFNYDDLCRMPTWEEMIKANTMKW